MYKPGLFAVFMLVSGLTFCQQQMDIPLFKLWSEDTPLQWEDYTITREKRILKTGFLADAVTSYQYKFIPGNWGVNDCVNVVILFIKSDSWVADTLNQAVLEHERLHFDIGELHARKLRKELHILFEEKVKNHEMYWTKIDSLFAEGMREQAAYDQETRYGQMKNMQQIWKKRVARELEQLEDFSFKKMMLRCNETSR